MSDADPTIQPIVMPKWGLAMQEGLLAEWHVEAGAALKKGDEIADIETAKIANVFESPIEGTVRRLVARPGDTLQVGALIAVVAPAETEDAAIDAYVEAFQGRFAAEAADAAPPPEPETIEAVGRRLRYLAQGEGDATPALLLHGFGGDYLSWMFTQEALSAERRAYALDLPGHGGSTKDVGDGLPSLAAAILAFMDAKGIAKAHLVGHSMGGALSLLLAREHPDRVASLTLIAPGGLGAEIDGAFLDGFIQEKRPKKLRAVLERLVADPDAITAEMVEEVVRFKRLDGAEAALRSLRAALAEGDRQRGDLRGVLSKTDIPVLVVWGEADRILPASHADGLPEGVSVLRLERTGHLPHMERAEEVNAKLGEHLRAADG